MRFKPRRGTATYKEYMRWKKRQKKEAMKK